jgi:hypothetical protein
MLYAQEPVTISDNQRSTRKLEDLSDDEIMENLSQLDDATLISVIKEFGYTIDETQEKPSHQELADAAISLVIDYKGKLINQAEGETAPEAPADPTASTPSTTIETEPSVQQRTPPIEQQQQQQREAPPMKRNSAMKAGNRSARQDMVPDLDGKAEEILKDTPPPTTPQAPSQDNEEEEDPNLFHGLDPSTTPFWELFMAQVSSDFGPILKRVPAPIKEFWAKYSPSVLTVLQGAAEPMLRTLSKVFKISGTGLVKISEEMTSLSDYMRKKADGTPRLEGQSVA